MNVSFFRKTDIPDHLAVEKCTREQILMCFEAYEHPDCQTMFDWFHPIRRQM